MNWCSKDNKVITEFVFNECVNKGNMTKPLLIADLIEKSKMLSANYPRLSIKRKIYNTVYLINRYTNYKFKQKGLSHYSLLHGTAFIEVCDNLNVPLIDKPKHL